MSKNWDLVPLREILTKSENWIGLKPNEKYKQVTVKIWGKGVIERNEVTGAEISASKRLQVKSGQFIVSRIDARNGAFGLIPDCLDGAVVTNDFPVFTANFQRILPQFLGWMSKTANFVEICKAASEGTTNRVRLKEDHFLAMEILLPPLEEQRRIVARVEELAGKIEEARSLRQEALKETELIIGASLQKFFSPKNDSIELGKVSTVIDPNPSHRYPLYVDDGVPIISTVDFVGEDGISTAQAKRVPLSFYEDTLGRFGVGDGDIIFSRKGKVGYARRHPANAKLAMTHTLCVIQPDRNKILPRYLLHFTRSPALIDYLMGTMNPNVGVPTLGLGVIRSAPFNLPPLPEQRRIVAYLDNLQTKVDEMKRLREGAMKELNAMLPSILDKAFKGEL